MSYVNDTCIINKATTRKDTVRVTITQLLSRLQHRHVVIKTHEPFPKRMFRCQLTTGNSINKAPHLSRRSVCMMEVGTEGGPGPGPSARAGPCEGPGTGVGAGAGGEGGG